MLSIVIPLYNEAGNVAPLVAEIHAALAVLPHEIVLVDDGSKDETLAEARALPGVRVLSHQKSCWQSAALLTGIRAAAGEFVVTMDGDGQNDPADIPALWAKFQELAAGGQNVMVMGDRSRRRRDNLVKRLTSRVGNAIRQTLLKDGVKDTGCSLKVFRRADFLALPFFDHIHRFMPALMRREGVQTYAFPVNHRPRQRGISKYGFWDRLWVSLSDILGAYWLLHRRRLPKVQEFKHVG